MRTEIQIPAAELRNALAGFNKVMSRLGLPILRHIRLTRESAGPVRLQATDLDQFLTYDVQESTPGPSADFLIPIDPLSKAVKSTKGCVGIIPDKESVELCTWVGTTPLAETYSSLDVAEWPKVPVVTRPSLPLDQKFRDTLRHALECTLNDASASVLNGVCIDVSKPDAHYVVATDRKHLYTANSFSLALPEPVTIPNTRFIGWAEFLEDGDLALAVQPPEGPTLPEYVQITSKRWKLITKAIAGNYPNWRAVMPADREVSHAELSREAIRMLLDIIPRLPGSDLPNQTITIRTGEGTLSVAGRTRTGAGSAISIRGASIYGLPEAMVHLDRRHVLKALRFGLDNLEIQDELSTVRFFTEGRQLLIMPVRPDAVVAPPPTVPAPTAPTTNTETTTNPSASSENQATETERKDTSVKTNTTTMTAPERGNLKAHTPGAADESATKALADKLESAKGALRDLQTTVTEALALVRSAERESRLKEKEVESIRATVRSLQKVQI